MKIMSFGRNKNSIPLFMSDSELKEMIAEQREDYDLKLNRLEMQRHRIQQQDALINGCLGTQTSSTTAHAKPTAHQIRSLKRLSDLLSQADRVKNQIEYVLKCSDEMYSESGERKQRQILLYRIKMVDDEIVNLERILKVIEILPDIVENN